MPLDPGNPWADPPEDGSPGEPAFTDYRCRWCGHWFVVPSLARHHETNCIANLRSG